MDIDRLAGWFDAHAPGLLLYARQWVTDRAAAEDLVQDAFIRLMEQGRPPANVRAWLYRAVRSLAIDAARSSARRGRRERAVAGLRGAWFDGRPDDRIDAAAAQAALQELPAVQRQVVVLRLWSGLTLAETAEVSGLPLSTAYDHYRIALATLRQTMGATPCPTLTTPK